MMERWELPKGWEWRRLGDICKTTSGGTPKRNVAGYYGGTIPWLKSGELDDGLILRTEETITEKGLNESNAKIFPKGTLLIALYGATVGKLGILGIDAATNQAICAIFPSYNVENTFLFWFLRAIRQKLLKSSFGGAQPNISQEIIRNLEVPIPYPNDPDRSLAEQRRIVARLELLLGETRAMREDIQAMRRDLAQVMESALAEVFPNPNEEMPKGWGWKRLGDIAPEDSQQIFPTDYPGHLFNYWGLDAIEKGQIDEPAPNFVAGSSIQSTCIKFTSEHVLYCKLRPYLNKVIVPSSEGIGSTEWVPLRPNPEIIERKFLAFALRTPQFVQYATSNVAGARMPRMSKRALEETKIPIPYPDNLTRSLAEQRRIVAYLEHIAEEIRAMDDVLAQDLRDAEALEQSILAAAFRGEV